MKVGGISSGPAFRAIDRHGRVSPDRLATRSVSRLVKEWAAAAGLDPTHISAHSLRAGFATAAAQAGRSERDIMRHGRWRSVTNGRPNA